MTTSVDLPEGLKEDVESELEKGYYASKSDLIRDAIRHLLEERSLSEEARTSIRKARNSEAYSMEELKEMHDIDGD